MLPHIYGRGGIENVLDTLLSSRLTDDNEVTVVLPDTEDVSVNDKDPNLRPWMDNFRHKVTIIERCQQPKFTSSNAKVDRIKRLLFCFHVLKNTDADIVVEIYMKPILMEAKIKKLFHKHYQLVGWFHTSLSTYRYGQEVFDKYGKHADQFLAISSGIENQLVEMGVSANKIHKVYNPAVRQGIVPLAEDKPYRFVYIGRMDNEQKNITGMFDAFSQIDNKTYQLDIYGDGADMQWLQEYARDKKINVVWHGWSENPWEAIEKDAVNALILTSNYEGFGMVLTESIARGIPVISSNCVAGPDDIVQPGVNGYLYEVGNQDELVKTIEKMITQGTNWNQSEIQHSIHYLYTDEYVHRFGEVLRKIKEENE